MDANKLLSELFHKQSNGDCSKFFEQVFKFISAQTTFFDKEFWKNDVLGIAETVAKNQPKTTVAGRRSSVCEIPATPSPAQQKNGLAKNLQKSSKDLSEDEKSDEEDDAFVLSCSQKRLTKSPTNHNNAQSNKIFNHSDDSVDISCSPNSSVKRKNDTTVYYVPETQDLFNENSENSDDFVCLQPNTLDLAGASERFGESQCVLGIMDPFRRSTSPSKIDFAKLLNEDDCEREMSKLEYNTTAEQSHVEDINRCDSGTSTPDILVPTTVGDREGSKTPDIDVFVARKNTSLVVENNEHIDIPLSQRASSSSKSSLFDKETEIFKLPMDDVFEMPTQVFKRPEMTIQKENSINTSNTQTDIFEMNTQIFVPPIAKISSFKYVPPTRPIKIESSNKADDDIFEVATQIFEPINIVTVQPTHKMPSPKLAANVTTIDCDDNIYEQATQILPPQTKEAQTVQNDIYEIATQKLPSPDSTSNVIVVQNRILNDSCSSSDEEVDVPMKASKAIEQTIIKPESLMSTKRARALSSQDCEIFTPNFINLGTTSKLLEVSKSIITKDKSINIKSLFGSSDESDSDFGIVCKSSRSSSAATGDKLKVIPKISPTASNVSNSVVKPVSVRLDRLVLDKNVSSTAEQSVAPVKKTKPVKNLEKDISNVASSTRKSSRAKKGEKRGWDEFIKPATKPVEAKKVKLSHHKSTIFASSSTLNELSAPSDATLCKSLSISSISSNSSLESTTSSTRSSRNRVTEKHHIMFTQINRKPYESKFKTFGVEIVDTPKSCTLLVSDKIYRTCKFLCAMAKGIPIVSEKWAKAVLRAKCYIDPMNEEYLLVDKVSEKRYQFTLAQSIESARKEGILSGYTVFVTMDTIPPAVELNEIIGCAGGRCVQVTDLSKSPKSDDSDKVFAICNKTDTKFWKIIKKQYPKCVVTTTEDFMVTIMKQSLKYIKDFARSK